MTEEEQKAIDAIERDRRRREDELLLLLLLISGLATRHAVYAARMGHDPISALNDVIYGNPGLELEGIAPSASNILQLSHQDGVKRAYRLAGQKYPTPQDVFGPNVGHVYDDAANRLAKGLADGMGKRIGRAMDKARTDGIGPKGLPGRIRESLIDGYSKSDPWTLEDIVETNIVTAHTAGMVGGGQAVDAIWGFNFVAVLDDVTTTICKTCAGTKQPKDSAWFFNHTPPMHFNCRSALLPILTDSKSAVATAAPSIQPMPGFGVGVPGLSVFA